jgi:predicted negative regulator of RcsB-dependent stress response
LKAHEALPDDPTIAEHLGDIHGALKEYDKAFPFYEKSIQLEKDKKKKELIQKKMETLKEQKK